jgi:superfamily II DNA or RNA helicase
VAQLSEGISIPNLRVGIIWHAFGKERKAAQRIGQLLHLNFDQTATMYLLVYQDTVDEQSVDQALESFYPAKINYVDATVTNCWLLPRRLSSRCAQTTYSARLPNDSA